MEAFRSPAFHKSLWKWKRLRWVSVLGWMLLETSSVEATVHHALTSQGLCADCTAYVSKNWRALKARNVGLAENISSQVSG